MADTQMVRWQKKIPFYVSGYDRYIGGIFDSGNISARGPRSGTDDPDHAPQQKDKEQDAHTANGKIRDLGSDSE